MTRNVDRTARKHGRGGSRRAALALTVAVLSAAATQLSAAQLKHPTVPNPATLTGPRAEQIYRAIRDEMRAVYGRSSDPVYRVYQNWRRFNRFPYRSGPHGERFVNHYGNERAHDYLRVRRTGRLPVGAIVMKDSFTFTRDGNVLAGPLFMMEKMARGFPSPAGNWRFLMVGPDGAVVGMTGGAGAERVRFCAACHAKAGPETDYLFLMPGDVMSRDGK